MFNFLRYKPKQVRVPESFHNQLIKRVKMIRPELAMNVFSPNWGNSRIRASYRNIQEYNVFLINIIKNFENPKGIRAAYFQNVPSFYPLKDWYVGSNGLYLDAQYETITFQERSILLIEGYIELEKNQTAESRSAVLNLGPIINQIKEITEQLILTTQGNETIEKLKSAVRRDGF